MSQNISLWGATYNNVPAVDLPKAGGGTARFNDTTDADATSSDILDGKTAYVNGAKITGTGTGGGGSVTQDQDGYIVLPSTGGGGGGGSSSCVQGTFTTSSTAGAYTIDTSYTGNGFPMAMVIYIPEGYNNYVGTVFNTVHKYGVVQYILLKTDDTQPEYSGNGSTDRAYRTTRYKADDADSSSYSAGSATTSLFNNTDATSSASSCLRIKSATQFSVYVSSAGNYGFIPNTEYVYCISYSS